MWPIWFVGGEPPGQTGGFSGHHHGFGAMSIFRVSLTGENLLLSNGKTNLQDQLSRGHRIPGHGPPSQASP